MFITPGNKREKERESKIQFSLKFVLSCCNRLGTSFLMMLVTHFFLFKFLLTDCQAVASYGWILKIPLYFLLSFSAGKMHLHEQRERGTSGRPGQRPLNYKRYLVKMQKRSYFNDKTHMHVYTAPVVSTARYVYSKYKNRMWPAHDFFKQSHD